LYFFRETRLAGGDRVLARIFIWVTSLHQDLSSPKILIHIEILATCYEFASLTKAKEIPFLAKLLQKPSVAAVGHRRQSQPRFSLYSSVLTSTMFLSVAELSVHDDGNDLAGLQKAT
jgi:hypothetical protein